MKTNQQNNTTAVNTNIINLTPHPLKIQLLDGTFLELSKPAEGTKIPRRETLTEVGKPLYGVPVATVVLGPVKDLPPIIGDVIYVVSRIVVDGAPHRYDLFAPGEAIRDSEGKIVGAKGLAR